MSVWWWSLFHIKQISKTCCKRTSKSICMSWESPSEQMRWMSYLNHHGNGKNNDDSLCNSLVQNCWCKVIANVIVNHSVWIYIHVSNVKPGISPNNLWSKMKFPLNWLHNNVHVFGCPIHILLEKKLADGKSMPRWEACSQRVMYLGQAPDCTGSKPLVLNLQTRNITS